MLAGRGILNPYIPIIFPSPSRRGGLRGEVLTQSTIKKLSPFDSPSL
jgi:hypothetical protein